MDKSAEGAARQLLQDWLLGELAEPARTLLMQVQQLHCGCSLLELVDQREREWLTLEDMAYHLQAAPTCVETTLRELIALGLTRRRDISGMTFFGLGGESEARQKVRELCAWKRRWQATLMQLQALLNG